MAVSEGVVNKGLIGKGAFGCVYLVENKDGEQFAIKVMEWLHARSTERGVVVNELRVLNELSHKNLICYVDHFQDKGLMFVITEYCSGGDLSDFLDAAGRALPEDLLRVWLWQMVCGLEYMHNNENGPVLHRDLKPSNVLLSDSAIVRLGDMGIARKLEKADAMATTFCGTPPYMSPEALCEKPHNVKTDIWSLGCCVVEMATLKRAYQGSTLFILRNAVLNKPQPLPGDYTRELDRLVSKMLKADFQRRISASEVQNSSVLQDCEAAEPMDLLLKHNLQGALAFNRSSPTSTATSQPHTLSTVADETICTLRGSLSNLKDILDEGEPITSYRIKLDKRMGGRRPNDDTITNSASIQTVIYRPVQTTTSKSTKKTLKVPAAKTPARDESLSMSVLSSMTSTVMSMRETGRGTQPPGRSADAQLSDTCATGVSRSTQTDMLRRSLTEVVGSSQLKAASTVVTTASTEQELMSGLSTLVGDADTLLSHILIYFLLTDFVTSSGLASDCY